MKNTFLPTTSLGKWSVLSVIGFALSIAALYLMIFLGERGGEGFFTNLWLAIPGLLAAVFGILSFLVGVIAVFWKRERSILVFVATIIGLLVLLFVSGEILFPH